MHDGHSSWKLATVSKVIGTGGHVHAITCALAQKHKHRRTISRTIWKHVHKYDRTLHSSGQHFYFVFRKSQVQVSESRPAILYFVDFLIPSMQMLGWCREIIWEPSTNCLAIQAQLHMILTLDRFMHIQTQGTVDKPKPIHITISLKYHPNKSLNSLCEASLCIMCQPTHKSWASYCYCYCIWPKQ
jgi:hypothetical protein